MPSIWEWLSQIDTTPPPSSPAVDDSYIPPYYRSEEEQLPDPSSSFNPAQPRFGRKQLLTSISFRRTKETEIHFARLALQLARASRETRAACLEYRQLRVHELNMMQAIARDEYNEAVTLNDDVAYHQSCIHELEAMHVVVLEEYQEAIALLRNADLGLKRAEENLVSMGEQVPPAFSQSRPGSQAPVGSSSHSVSSDSHSTTTK